MFVVKLFSVLTVLVLVSACQNVGSIPRSPTSIVDWVK